MDKRIIVALALVVAGCWKDDAACRTAAADLTAYLSAMEHEPSVVPGDVFEHLHVPLRTNLPHSPVPEAPLVIVSPTEITYQGQLVDPEALGPLLTSTFAKIIADPKPKGFVPQLDLLIDADVEWGTVAKLGEVAASSGFEHLAVIFTRPATSPVPPPRSTLEMVEQAKAMEKLLRSCRSVGKLLGSLGSVENGDKAQMLIDGIGPALLDCKCDVDLAALRSTIWELIGQPHPASALVLTLAREARPLELPATLHWADANKYLAPKTHTWFVAH